ncbi:uncharacterized protein LOC119681962 [Teleopsis dalmanni]|uniref:uncharacterized protein LOC119681962 n=1 Tax=Teleopsis dalmanni TaxID=139649 RepID=UPI0018CC7F61|nr:uncharacterized protein LOC119681962 [Teleopsis dalmanni]
MALSNKDQIWYWRRLREKMQLKYKLKSEPEIYDSNDEEQPTTSKQNRQMLKVINIKTDTSEQNTQKDRRCHSTVTDTDSDDEEILPVSTSVSGMLPKCQILQKLQTTLPTTTTKQQQQQIQSPTILSNNSSALIAFQQLASISSAQSLKSFLPNLPKHLINSDSLVQTNRTGKLPRQSTKRLSQFEANRCPLCSRVYRSQAFLNEHMRKEHSILI